MKSQVFSMLYELDVEDPIEVIADFGCLVTDSILSKAHDPTMGGDGGVTISAHGAGTVWLSREDVPELINALKEAVKDRELAVKSVKQSGDAGKEAGK